VFFPLSDAFYLSRLSEARRYTVLYNILAWTAATQGEPLSVQFKRQASLDKSNPNDVTNLRTGHVFTVQEFSAN